MTDEQVAAACGEARALGLRIVGARAQPQRDPRRASAAAARPSRTAARRRPASCELMAARGTYFEPNIGLVSQNYLENSSRYFGIGNFDEAGFAFTEKGSR